MKIKETIHSAAERVYDVLKDERYTINVKKTGVKVKNTRPTRHTIKWHAKNH